MQEDQRKHSFWVAQLSGLTVASRTKFFLLSTLLSSSWACACRLHCAASCGGCHNSRHHTRGSTGRRTVSVLLPWGFFHWRNPFPKLPIDIDSRLFGQNFIRCPFLKQSRNYHYNQCRSRLQLLPAKVCDCLIVKQTVFMSKVEHKNFSQNQFYN